MKKLFKQYPLATSFSIIFLLLLMILGFLMSQFVLMFIVKIINNI